MRMTPFLLALASLGLPLGAQSLLIDANSVPEASPPGSRPDSFTSDGRLLLFAARDGAGEELWASDGSAGGTRRVADLLPGKASSHPRFITFLRPGVALLEARLGLGPTTGPQSALWRTDGTAGGTWRLDLAGLEPEAIAAFRGEGYVVARSRDRTTYELWRTDGSVGSTRKVVDLAGGASLHPTAGSLFFFQGRDLWVSDGTAAGTSLVRTFTSVKAIEAAGDELFVLAGTHLFAYGGSPVREVALARRVYDLATAGRFAYYTESPTLQGTSLWRTDGTPAGLLRLGELAPFGASSGMRGLGALGDELVFVGKNGADESIYVSDGAAPGIRRLSGVGVRSGARGVELGGRLYFAARDAAGQEPWVTDGTPAGTYRIVDLSPGVGNGVFPDRFAAVGGRVAFGGEDPIHGREPFVTDGTAQGTVVLLDIQSLAPGATAGSDPTPLGRLGDVGFFSTQDPLPRLWRTDGTPGGTSPLVDLGPRRHRLTEAAFADDWFLFEYASGTAWVSDGTVAGTGPLFTTLPAPGWGVTSVRGAALDGNRVVFAAFDQVHGTEPWVSDGTPAGTVRLADLDPSAPLIRIQYFVAHGGLVWFVAAGLDFISLYRTDGTRAGTLELARFGYSSFALLELHGVDSGLVFTVTDPIGQASVWRTDGTPAGTAPLPILPPGQGAGLSIALDGEVVLTSFDGSGTTFYRSDGTVAGTAPFLQVPGSARPVGVFGGSAFLYQVNDELWQADSLTGTRRLLGFAPVVPFGSIGYASPVAKIGVTTLLYRFGAYVPDDALQISDGTPGGTGELNVPWRDTALDRAPVRVGSWVLFAADDGVHGLEMHRLPVSALGDYVAEHYGRPCPFGASTPRIELHGAARVSSPSPFAIALEDAPPNAAALLGFSDARGATAVGGCTVLLGGNVFVRSLVTDAEGAASVLVPPDPALVDRKLDFQYAVADGAGVSLTDALEIVVGP